MRRPGLFRLFYWRAVMLLVCSLAVIFGLTYYVHTRLIYPVWQDDIQQETDWIASLWTENTRPQEMAETWRMSHDTVRLFVRDAKGRIVADSHPERPPVPPDGTGLGILVGTAPIPGGELVLSRSGQRAVPMHPEIPLLLAGLGIAAALFFLPLVRRLKSGLDRISGLAARVAEGQFGATIEPPRERELAELTLSLNEMSLRLRDQEQRERRLVADISHELRSPMGRLRALAETVARQPDEARGHLLRINEEISLLDRLIDEMLEMEQFDESKVDLTRRDPRL